MWKMFRHNLYIIQRNYWLLHSLLSIQWSFLSNLLNTTTEIYWKNPPRIWIPCSLVLILVWIYEALACSGLCQVLAIIFRSQPGTTVKPAGNCIPSKLKKNFHVTSECIKVMHVASRSEKWSFIPFSCCVLSRATLCQPSHSYVPADDASQRGWEGGTGRYRHKSFSWS